jgi:hypothetical protein
MSHHKYVWAIWLSNWDMHDDELLSLWSSQARAETALAAKQAFPGGHRPCDYQIHRHPLDGPDAWFDAAVMDEPVSLDAKERP